jgi:hypothetical protein
MVVDLPEPISPSDQIDCAEIGGILKTIFSRF